MKQTITIFLLTPILLGIVFGCNSKDEKKQDRTEKEQKEIIKTEVISSTSSISLLNIKSNNLDDNLLLNENGPTMIVFWATTCGPCIKELNTFSPLYEKWKNEYDLKLVAVSPEYPNKIIVNQLAKKYNTNTDTLIKRQNVRIENFLKKHSFNFELYMDSNDELTDFLHSYKGIDTTYISSGYFNGKPRVWVPQTILLDKDGKLHKQKVGFKSGDEKEIETILRELTKNAL